MEEMTLRRQIADNIRAYRARKRFSQEKLAQMCDTTQQYINQIENEKVNLSTFILVKIAEALDVDANQLVY